MIRMSEQKDMSGDKTLSGGGFNINPVDIIMYLLSNGTGLYCRSVCSADMHGINMPNFPLSIHGQPPS